MNIKVLHEGDRPLQMSLQKYETHSGHNTVYHVLILIHMCTHVHMHI